MLIESSKVWNVKVLVWPQAVFTFIYLLSNTYVTGCESDILYLFLFFYIYDRTVSKLPCEITVLTLNTLYCKIAKINE